MGSHYIPVGKIKIDKEILDIACPAAGYGETPPDPAIYCPANGYIQEDEPWVSPVVTPQPGNEEILLICSDYYEAAVSVRIRTLSSYTRCELLSSSMSVISSIDKNTSSLTTFDIDFPTRDTGTVYIIRFSIVTQGGQFTEFRSYNVRADLVGDWMILEAKFNTPNMQKLEYAFDGMTNFKVCHFYSNMDSLTSFMYGFRNTSLERIEGIKHFAILTSFNNTFYGTPCKFWDFTDWYAPNAFFPHAFRYSRVENVIFSENCGLIADYTFENTPLKTITAPNNILKIAGAYCRYTFQNAPNFIGTDSVNKAIKFEITDATVSIERILYDSLNIKKIEFIGTANGLTNMSFSFSGTKSLEELILPTSMNSIPVWSSTIRYTNKLKKITLPISMASWTAGWTNNSIPNNNIIEELTTCETYHPDVTRVWLYGTRWKKVIQPSLKVHRLYIGNSATGRCLDLVGDIDIDFENSPFEDSPAILLYANLPASELDAIYTRLPDFTGSTIRKIYASSNPGYAASNVAIATAKNWDVL